MGPNPNPEYVEILPKRLYYYPQNSTNFAKQPEYRYFSVDDELVYWNFFLDFGPLNLAQLYRFCRIVHGKLGPISPPSASLRRSNGTFKNQEGEIPLVLHSGPSREKQTNTVYLLFSYLLLHQGMTVEDICFENQHLRTLSESCLSFHDASQGICTYKLTVLDCLRGLHKARTLRFFDFGAFDVLEYEHFEAVENGDLNWVVYPNNQNIPSNENMEGSDLIMKPILAFAGPHYHYSVTKEGYVTLTPASYINYFKRKNVRLVVRLNQKMYDESEFTRHGIQHIENSYQDGSTPPLSLLLDIIEEMEKTQGGIAVHCKAGLGRTGTIIGAYLMKHFKLTHSEVIAWMRICRPGMVIGPQQHFLREIEQMMWYEGGVYRSRVERRVFTSQEEKIINKNMKELTIDERKHPNGMITTDNQADGLLMARMQREVMR